MGIFPFKRSWELVSIAGAKSKRLIQNIYSGGKYKWLAH